mmetsp:Transcript_24710/g.67231  ORF Transcript_24710/g.67231 Transcript_24710/m.67231 type:complete len:162 (+) Transcript_24710:258-743(+)
MQAYSRKFGEERARFLFSDANPMLQRFRDVGVNLSFGGLTGNTLDAHRLATHAYSVGGTEMQDRLMNELFLDYFERERYPGARSVLLDAAERAGVPDAHKVVDDPDYLRTEVDKELKQWGRGVRGVPHFVINDGEIVFSGAQPAEAWVEIFEEQVEKQAEG